MLWIKAFHIIFMVTWFAGLFYLPRIFVYHAQSSDDISIKRFKIMERRLYRGIMTPGAILTTVFGMWLLTPNYSAYVKMGWMHAKLSLIVLLWLYHLHCGHLVKVFASDNNKRSHVFYRWYNEVPTVLLLAIVVLVVVKPF